jgi:hypothetical protein
MLRFNLRTHSGMRIAPPISPFSFKYAINLDFSHTPRQAGEIVITTPARRPVASLATVLPEACTKPVDSESL